MSAEQFGNNASTTLGSALSSAATVVTVATGTGSLFPAITGTEFFTATLWAAGSSTGVPNEIVKVTARSGDTMTVVRAQEGTSAQNWNVGDTFANYPTAAFLSGLVQEVDVQQQTGNYAADSGSANAGAVALTPVPASLASLLGSPIRVKKVASNNTGAYTLNVNGLGAVPVVLPGGSALVSGALVSGGVFNVVYDGTAFELQSTPGVISISGTAGGDLTGTYPSPTVAADAITNGKLALMPASTVKLNDTGGAANPQDVSYLGLWSNTTLAVMPAGTFKSNLTGGSAEPADNTVASVLAALGIQTFTSAGQTILPVTSTAGAEVSVAHGLGAVPFGASMSMVCLTADLGYSVGDELVMPGASYSGGAGGPTDVNGGQVFMNATTVGYAYNTISVMPKAGSNPTQPTNNAFWQFVFRAWLL